MYGSMVTFELPAAMGHQAPWLSDHMLSFSTLLLFISWLQLRLTTAAGN